MRQRETKTPRSALARRLVLVGLVVVGLFGVDISRAGANTYQVEECGPPKVTVAPDAHVSHASQGYPPGVDCIDENFGLGIAGNPAADKGAAELDETAWSLQAPDGTIIVRLAAQYRLYSSCGNIAYLHGITDSGVESMIRVGWEAPLSDCHRMDGGCITYWCVVQGDGLALRRFDLVMYCADRPAPFNGCATWVGGFALLKNIDMTVDDRMVPDPPTLGGSIAQGGPRRGTESLIANVSDKGSGVASVRVLVNGGQIGDQTQLPCSTNGGTSAAQFTPCPSSTAVTLSADTDQGPWREGANVVKVCSTDYSGLTGCSETPVTVDNSCDDSVGSTIGSNLDAGLARGNEHPRVNTLVSSKEGITVKGTVTTAAGAPVPGANVCLYEQVAAGGEQKVLADIVHTKNNGSFVSQIDPGPSRDVYVDYRHSNLLLEKQLQLDSTTSPLLKIKKRKVRNGKAMRFGGSIPGPYNAGRIVTMQAKVGKKWKTFMQATTDTVGEFKGRYRFQHSTVRRAKYRFRAVVREQAGYPYASGISNTAKVIVKG